MSSSPNPRRAASRWLVPLRFLWRLVLAAVKLTLLATLLLVLAGAWLYYEYGRNLPDPDEIRQHRPFETTHIYASDGRTLLYELVDPQAGRRTIVAFEHIPRILKDATVAVEDAGFYDHPGVDWRGIVRAAWINYQSGDVVSGGSTITQQLVRNVLLPPQERGRNLPTQMLYERKLREVLLAVRVSQQYSKDQILSLYLNEVYYGAQAYGVEAAAQAYFGKHVWELTDGEATLLAGLPQSPTRLNPFTNFEGARQRQRITLNLMVKAGYLTPLQADAIFNEPLNLITPEIDILAPHFVFYVRDLLEQRYGPDMLYRGGLNVVTSLDMHWQEVAQQTALQRINELRARNAHNASVIMLDPNHRILAMVGSIDYYNPVIDGEVNVALAPRQPGSALKPFVYAAAMQRGWSPATVLWDEPTTFNQDGVAYVPRNYDNSWHGPQRVRMALANSLNIPAVKALEFVGVQEFVQLASAFGITTFNDPARYGLSMALGSGEVRLLELTNAYNTLRNGGYYQPPVAILKVTNNRGEVLEQWSPRLGQQVLGMQGEQIAYLIGNILSDNQARWYMFGRGNVMELPDGRPAAVKTGTSNDWRDSWALGYTPHVAIGVWVGNNDNVPMQEIAGANGGGLIWRDLIMAYHTERGLEPKPFERPPNITEATVCADTGGQAGTACPRPITELFVAGMQPPAVDIVYQTMRVSNGGTCLAATYTPPEAIQSITYAVYPPQFRDWAQRNGIPQPPTERCPPVQQSGQALAQLFPVSDGRLLLGEQVEVRGVARGPFQLEVGVGSPPTAWQQVSSGLAQETPTLLGIWQTSGLPPGVYTLRLRVATADGISADAVQVVTIEE
ncbi:MAG: penicillin-binding protein [Chloroflexaceae bacterium]|nr:penicillin-binding protein [Chloroflexaceae bacterium]